MSDKAESAALREAKAKKAEAKPWDREDEGKNKGERPRGLNAVELFAKEFPPTRFVIDGLIGDGLTILCGKPKQGKSWLALLAAWAVASGKSVDGREVWQGDVLYLALEDNMRRLQGRMRSLQADLGWSPPESLTLCTEWSRADDRGLWWIHEWLLERQGRGRLVIVDVLSRFRRPAKGAQNAYDDDYEAVNELKKLADFHKTSAMYIHHTRKLRAEDPFDEISGTHGVSGPADTLMVMESKGGTGKLYAKGRDIAESTTSLTFTKTSGRWTLGTSIEGIDTEGRDTGGIAGMKQTKVEACMDWLRQFLKEFAFPECEVEAEAKKSGFSFSAYRDAKWKLGRNGTGEIRSANFGGGGKNDWWIGLGPPVDWKHRKPITPDVVVGNTGRSGMFDEIPT